MTNEEAAARHVRRIVGPTILLGDGSYYDFENPEATSMTIEDYAYALAFTVRFRGQCRCALQGNRRVFYGVGEHCIRLANALRDDGHGPINALAGLFHESGEVPWGDVPGPAKPLIGGFKPLEKRAEKAINAYFSIETPDPDLIKRYDLKMLATEKRDLMPQGGTDRWGNAEDAVADVEEYGAFPWRIIPYVHPEQAAASFVDLYAQLMREIGQSEATLPPASAEKERQPFWATCANEACGEHFIVCYLPMEAKIAAEIAMKARCPMCGSRKSFVAKQDHGVVDLGDEWLVWMTANG